MNELLLTEYVPIDIRLYLSLESIENWVKITVLSALLSLPNTSTETVDYWKQQVLSRSLSDIVKTFQTQRKTHFFFHFDEVDSITHLSPQVNGTNLQTVTRYYKFWELIQPIMRVGSFVYCSGRSSLLYALGRKMYHSQGLDSK